MGSMHDVTLLSIELSSYVFALFQEINFVRVAARAQCPLTFIRKVYLDQRQGLRSTKGTYIWHTGSPQHLRMTCTYRLATATARATLSEKSVYVHLRLNNILRFHEVMILMAVAWDHVGRWITVYLQVEWYFNVLHACFGFVHQSLITNQANNDFYTYSV